MTVCIAALADNGKKAILIADKLGTNQGVLPHQKEDIEKIIKMNDNVSVMFAGNTTDAQTIVSEAKRTLNAKKWVKEIAEHLNEKYLEYLHEVLDLQYVRGRGIEGGTEAFYGDKNLNLSTEERKEISNILANYTLGGNTTFLVCGRESDGNYRIYSCGPNPRIIPFRVPDGYAAIGSGGNYAIHSFLFSDYKPSLPILEVKKLALEAKKRAEKTHDVGEKEDVIDLE